MSTKMILATCLFAATASAENVNFLNLCDYEIQLFHSQSAAAVSLEANIPTGGKHSSTVTGSAHMFRHTSNPSSTLFEISIADSIFYDISIIVTNPGYCDDYDVCKRKNGTKPGFNVPMSVVPTSNGNKDTCSSLFCAGDDKTLCADAYLFPMDNTKTHSCPCGTSFDVTFCHVNGDNNNGGHGNQEQQEQKELPTIPSGANPDQQTSKLVENPIQQEGGDTTQQEMAYGGNGNQGQQEQKEMPTMPSVANSDQQTSKLEENPIQQEGGDTTLPMDNVDNVSKKNPLQSTNGDVSPIVQDDVSIVAGPIDVRAKYTYSGECAGNVPGTYDAVVDLPTCTKKPVEVNSRVGPLGSSSVSLVLRGPMSVLNIAVFTSNGAYDPLKRVSSYSSAEQTTDNLVFMSNVGVDYSGKGQYGPQSYVSPDGKKATTMATVFNGILDDASDPSTVGGGPSITTGTEINILAGEKCTKETCEGYFGDNDHAGWKGSLMVFVTEVIMFKGPTVDRPALWMLPASVMHSGQYGCNCRGMGPKGGCGELDIAEVIETNPQGDKLSTHHYFFNGKVLCPGGDNFFDRKYNESTTFITIIDDASAMIKIVEVATFDFHLLELGSLYDQLLTC
ncbi:hypothetical protein KXD40_008922 [Peronospora effusa]|uniref:Cell wall protein YJL171C/Tos1 C-terminal domain-containing protein n=1 Tax=Peronospora effusa TaxID=542832 RepID=A0A3M6VH39_9STRA|nr:hypothetical protein DD238_008028 [Peronospora effusa]RQM12099.1 hypothetical protein DD237_008127 [Peronospora effusa]UIZ21914.1 hypothetical protein KXD40_008922 [Peronospora effusa]